MDSNKLKKHKKKKEGKIASADKTANVNDTE